MNSYAKLAITLFSFIVYLSVSFGCVYLEDHASCDYRTDQGLNIISIDINDIGNFQSLTGNIQTPQGYLIPLEILEVGDGLVSLYQTRIFESFGVYTIKLNVVLEDGSSVIQRDFTVLYDDSNPLPPVVTDVRSLTQPENSLRVRGFTNHPGVDTHVIVFNNGEFVERLPLLDGTFESVFPKSDNNFIEIQTERENGRVSMRTALMYTDFDFNSNENIQTAQISNVDFISNNELARSTPQGIVSFSQTHHIQGRASNGNVVFVQGVPIPVINGNFQALLYLNEGEDEICVIGTNRECRTFTTIYSFGNSNFNLDINDITSFSLNSLNNNQFVQTMLLEGRSTNQVSEPIILSTPVDRNLFFVELFYPGVYEKHYILKDLEDPQIEIIASDNLYSFSEIGVKFRDDTRIDLDTLTLQVGSEILTYDDAINQQSQGKVTFAVFETPLMTQNEVTITAFVNDIEGNMAQDSKTVSITGRANSGLNVELLNSNRIIGNRIYISPDNDILEFDIRNVDINSQRTTPIALGAVNLDLNFINSYSIDSNNIVTLRVDVSQVDNISLLEIPVLVYEDSDSTDFDEFIVSYELYLLENNLDISKQFRVINSHVGDNSLTIVELLNDYIDFSTLKVNGRTDNFFVRGNYLFINVDPGSQISVSYRDIARNSVNFNVANRNSPPTIRQESSSELYRTYSIQNGQNVHLADLLMSNRVQNRVPIAQNSHFSLNPSPFEGLSVQTNSIFSNSRRTSNFDTQVNRLFSFSTYPTISVTGSPIFYRGLMRYSTSDTVTIQGRILGNDDISSARAQGRPCRIEERFFICSGIVLDSFQNEIEITFLDSSGNVVDDQNQFPPSQNVTYSDGSTAVDDKGNIYDKDQNIVQDGDGNLQNGVEAEDGSIRDNNGNTVIDSDGNVVEDFEEIVVDNNGNIIGGTQDPDGTIRDNEGNIIVDEDGNILDRDGNIVIDSDGNIVGGYRDQNGNIRDNKGRLVMDSQGNIYSTRREIIFSRGGDSSSDTVEIINPDRAPSSLLELDLSLNPNVFFSSEGFTFNSGDLTFNFTPRVDGRHSLFINGELVRDFEITNPQNQILIQLRENEYSSMDLGGQDLRVYVQDQNLQESNSIRMRFSRVLNAVLNIIIS